VLFCSRQIPHGLTSDLPQVPKLRGRRLTAYTVIRPEPIEVAFKKAHFICTRPVLLRCIQLSHWENCFLYENVNPKTSSKRRFVLFAFSFLIKHVSCLHSCFSSDKTYRNKRILYLVKRSSGCTRCPYFNVPLFSYSSCWCRIMMAASHQC